MYDVNMFLGHQLLQVFLKTKEADLLMSSFTTKHKEVQYLLHIKTCHKSCMVGIQLFCVQHLPYCMVGNLVVGFRVY